jgi:hypothetical protein
MKGIAELGRKHYPAYAWPRRSLPNMFMYMTSLFDSRITWSFCKLYLGRVMRFSNDKIKKELEMDFIPIEDAVLASAEGLLAIEAVPKK